MPARISKVTLVLETWDSGVRFYKRRVSFDVPPTDEVFYDLAHERWSAFSEAMWDGTGKQFNEVSQENL